MKSTHSAYLAGDAVYTNRSASPQESLSRKDSVIGFASTLVLVVAAAGILSLAQSRQRDALVGCASVPLESTLTNAQLKSACQHLSATTQFAASPRKPDTSIATSAR